MSMLYASLSRGKLLLQNGRLTTRGLSVHSAFRRTDGTFQAASASRPALYCTTGGSVGRDASVLSARMQIQQMHNRVFSTAGIPRPNFNAGSAATAATPAASRAAHTSLNDIERQILKAIVSGQSYQAIAADKGITSKSVEICRFRIQKKLDVDNIGLMRIAFRNPCVYETTNSVISEKAIKDYINDAKYKVRRGAGGSGSGGGVAAAPAAVVPAVVPAPAEAPLPLVASPRSPLPPPPPLQPPTPASLKKWDTAPRPSSSSSSTSSIGSTGTTSWPAAPKQFQQKVDYILSHPSMPLKTLYADSTEQLGTGTGTAAGAGGGGNNVNTSAEAEAAAHIHALAVELTGRAPKMSAIMLSNIFYSLDRLRDGSSSSRWWTKEQREKQGKLYLVLMKQEMHPTLLHLLAHILRRIKSSNAAATNTATTTGTTATTTFTAAASPISPNNNKKLVTTYKDGKKTVYIKETQRNPMTCVQYVCHGMHVVGIKWNDLGHLGQGLLDIISNPFILQSTRKWDLDHTLSTLGQMGLTWYQMSAVQRENICDAYIQIVQQGTSAATAFRSANTSTSARMPPSTTKGNSMLHTDVSSMDQSQGPSDASASATLPDIDNAGVYGTLHGLHSLGLSLREEEMPPALLDTIYRQILLEIPYKSGKKLVQLVDIIAQMSNRGMHKLPRNLQQAILIRLEAVHLDLPANKTNQSLGCSELFRALGQITSNLWNEAPSPAAYPPASHAQKQMLLAMATKCLNTHGNDKDKGSQFKRGQNLAVITQALARFGVKIDFIHADENLSHMDSETTLSELTFFSQCLNPVVVHAKSLPTALISIAKLADTYGGRDQIRPKDTVSSITLSSETNQKLDDFLDAIYPLVIANIESDAYNQFNIANVLWALGALGRPWQALPPKLQQAVLSKLAHEYSNKELLNSIHTEQSIGGGDGNDDDTTESVFGDFPVSAFGYPVPRSERGADNSDGKTLPSAVSAAREVTPSTSLLGKISTNSLESSMGTISSFRELIHPNIAELSQLSLYNWFGAIVKAKIPFNELPSQFSASLLVALTDDLPNQGGATVVQMAEYLSRLNLRVKTSNEAVHVPGVHIPHFLSAALLSQFSKRLHTADSYYLLRALSALSGMHGAPLAQDMHLVECGNVNYALSTTVCSSTMRALDNHVALLQHAHEYKILSGSNTTVSSVNTYKKGLKKVIPTGVYTPSHLLELVASIQRLTFHMPSKLQAQEVGEMHSAILRALTPDSLTDVQLLQMLSPPTAHEDISPAAKMIQTVSFLQYIGMSRDECVNILKNVGTYDCYMSLNPAFDYENMRVRSSLHELCSLQAFSMFALEKAEVYSRVTRAAGLAL